MTAYNRRFGKAPRHDFDVHRPLETDDDLTAFFTWREPRRVSKSLTVQYDKVLYLIEDNELSRRDIGKYIEDPATNTFNPAGPYPNIDHAKMVMNRWLDHWQTHSFGNWAISLLTNPEKSSVLAGWEFVIMTI